MKTYWCSFWVSEDAERVQVMDMFESVPSAEDVERMLCRMRDIDRAFNGDDDIEWLLNGTVALRRITVEDPDNADFFRLRPEAWIKHDERIDYKARDYYTA